MQRCPLPKGVDLNETHLTCSAAIEELRRLARGLQSSPAGVTRLLERAAAHGEPELLRDALVECGARLLLDNWNGSGH